MSESERYLRALRAGLPLYRRRRILAELRQHLEAGVADQKALGLSDAEAERVVVRRLGPPAALCASYAADLDNGALGTIAWFVAVTTRHRAATARVTRVASIASVLGLLALLQGAGAPGGKTTATLGGGPPAVAAYPFSNRLLAANGTISLASLRQHVVVVNFWQSYCPPCSREAAMISAISKRWARQGVVFVGVDEQDLSGPAVAFMKRFHIGFPVLSDNGPLVGHYGVTGYPETFFVDKRGYLAPMPATDGQVGHIVGAATTATLEAGIRNALAR